MATQDARILVVTDASSDADLVRRLLRDEFPQAQASTDSECFVADFERHRPQVLVLAFKTLEAAERYYLGLYRHSTLVNALPHRTLLLCGKDDVQHAYALCRTDYFDDYVLFWPLVHDAPRLPMSVHLALRALDATRAAAPLAQLAAQARRIAELEAQLEHQLCLGRVHVEQAQRSVQQAQAQVGAALDDFSQRMLATGLDEAVLVRNPARVQQEIGRLNDEAMQPPLRQAVQAVQPMQQWIGALQAELAAPLQAARALAEQVKRLPPLLLVVDDDEFLRKLLARILSEALYEVECVGSATEALNLLRTRRPDLILMDLMLPDIDGIEVTRRLKAAEAYATIPVIMLTGQSEKHVIVDSLAAGAADFVVKPFDRDILLKKVARYLGVLAPAD